VMVNTEPNPELSTATLVTIMVAVFTVSVGFGVVLPLLPELIERLLGGEVEAAWVSRHTGLLTAVYTFSLFLFAPIWGRLSDRHGPRNVFLVVAGRLARKLNGYDPHRSTR
jgi:MFS family permease